MGRHASFLIAFVLIAASCGTSDVEESAGCEVVEKASPAELELDVVTEATVEDADHVLCDVAYETSPPMGGDHFPVWQNCGFYTEPLTDEVAVHSLEHGAVWIAYSPDLDVAEQDAISAVVSTDPHLLAAPYPGLANPIVLTAWKRQVAVARISDAAAAEFLDDQLGRRSQTAPEAGASCGGAIGTPPFEPLTRYDEAVAQSS